MFIKIITLVAVGFAAAGFTMISFRLFGKKSPKALVIAMTGAGMLGFATWSTQNWSNNIQRNLPSYIQIVHETPYESWFEPWTKITAPIGHLTAIDHCKSPIRNENFPNRLIKNVLIFEIHKDLKEIRYMLDCEAKKSAFVPHTLEYDAQGNPLDLAWGEEPETAALLEALCTPDPARRCPTAQP